MFAALEEPRRRPERRCWWTSAKIPTRAESAEPRERACETNQQNLEVTDSSSGELQMTAESSILPNQSHNF